MKLTVQELHFETAPFRTPFKFGASVISELSVPQVKLRASIDGKEAVGTGAMPLGNAWSFPQVPYDQSLQVMQRIVDGMGSALDEFEVGDDPFEAAFALRDLAIFVAADAAAELLGDPKAVPNLCALVSSSPFDIALFDAWGKLAGKNTFVRLRSGDAGADLEPWLGEEFRGYSLAQVFPAAPSAQLSIFHVVGGLDPLTPAEVATPVGDELPNDLQSWIARDGLTHFKVKMRGSDPSWDYERILAVDRACLEAVRGRHGKDPVYSLDMNEQSPSAEVLTEFLKRLQSDAPEVLARIEFIEQPTGRDFSGEREKGLEQAARIKPIVIDEGLTDLTTLERALELGYSGVCLKACKGIGLSVLAAAVARKRNLYLCVQDLTCPGVSFLASASLAAWSGVDGLEANARQFCPAANAEQAKRRPEVFDLRDGRITTSGFTGAGLGY